MAQKLKKYKLEILNQARTEILEISRLYKGLVGAGSARKITASIKKSLALLRDQPLMGIVCRERQLAQEGYRMLICGNYLCFYRIIGDTVFVYHIVDGRTDYPVLLTDLLR